MFRVYGLVVDMMPFRLRECPKKLIDALELAVQISPLNMMVQPGPLLVI